MSPSVLPFSLDVPAPESTAIQDSEVVSVEAKIPSIVTYDAPVFSLIAGTAECPRFAVSGAQRDCPVLGWFSGHRVKRTFR